ncbi:DHHA1 domain-containing protein [soil metagenome]
MLPWDATAMKADPKAELARDSGLVAVSDRQRRSDRFLETLDPYRGVVLASHVNPDPDSLASMLGLKALIEHRQPGKAVTMTLDGILARAENQAMVNLLEIPLRPVEATSVSSEDALVMVDSQPHTGRRASEAVTPVAVLDHHETGGRLDGVAYRDIRPRVGATATMVTGYLLEQDVPITERVATALLYGIESETNGYPRDAGSSDDGALVWLYPRADKELLARIRHPRLPLSYFATFHHALTNAFLYGDVVISYCGTVPQPDLIAEIADFLIRFEEVHWAIGIGVYEGNVRLSARSKLPNGHSGEVLRAVVDGIGNAGGHDKRAGGAIAITEDNPEAINTLLTLIRQRLLDRLGMDEQQGRRLLEACPVIHAP